MRRFANLIATMALAGLAALPASSAGAQTCFIMQAELMHLLSQGQGGVGDRARYERAYREQLNALAITERQARRARCFGGGGKICAPCTATACRPWSTNPSQDRPRALQSLPPSRLARPSVPLLGR